MKEERRKIPPGIELAIAAVREGLVTKRTLGLLAGVLGSAVGAWLWARQRSASQRASTPARERGTVIFDNTPTAPPETAL
jgi:hypothetical protein